MRTVVVTGGGTGIGRAIAEAFVGAGDQVVIIGRRADVLSAAAEGMQRGAEQSVFWRSCDISDPDQVDAFAAWLVHSVSSTVDVLVNNAGGTGLISDDASTRDAAEYALSMLSPNLVGTYLMVHGMRPHLRRPAARIVNLSSIAAFRGGGDMYSAAKAGVVGLTYSMVGELGQKESQSMQSPLA